MGKSAATIACIIGQGTNIDAYNKIKTFNLRGKFNILICLEIQIIYNFKMILFAMF